MFGRTNIRPVKNGLYVHRNSRLIRDGEKGVWRWGEREIIYIPIATLSPPELPLLGSDESRFNVSLTVRDKVTRQCPQTTIFEEKRRAEADSNRGPSAYQLNALALGQTGSLSSSI